VCGQIPAAAQDHREQDDGDGWSIRLTPYLWMSALEGKLATLSGVPAAEVDASFGDLLESLDFAFMAFLDARRGKFGVLTEISYMRLSGDADTPGALFDDVDLTSTAAFLTGLGTYEALAGGAWTLDAMAGGRLWYERTELDFAAGTLPGRQTDEDEVWFDPLIGARLRVDLPTGFLFIGQADIGGFDLGSDFTWEAIAVAGYRFNERVSVQAGYRHMEVDYDHGDFLYDIELSGPIVGTTFRF
jgi:hypothetical protein